MRTDVKGPSDLQSAGTFRRGAEAFEAFTPAQLAKLSEYVLHLEYASRMAFVGKCAEAAGLEIRGDIYDSRCTVDIVLRALAVLGPEQFLQQMGDLRDELGDGQRGWERAPQYFSLFGRDFVPTMRSRIGELRDHVDMGGSRRDVKRFLGSERKSNGELTAKQFASPLSELLIRETRAKT